MLERRLRQGHVRGQGASVVVDTHGTSSTEAGGLACANEVGQDNGIIGVGDSWRLRWLRLRLRLRLGGNTTGSSGDVRARIGIAVSADELERRARRRRGRWWSGIRIRVRNLNRAPLIQAPRLHLRLHPPPLPRLQQALTRALPHPRTRKSGK